MRVIVIGCGRVGSELARSLSTQGHQVAVIDREQGAFLRLGPSFGGRTVMGDVMDEAVLRRAGIETAEAFASVTPSDEANLVAAKTARDVFHVPHVVARVYDPAFAQVFTHAGLPSVASSSWGARRIEQALTGSNVAEVESFGNEDVVLVQIRVPLSWAGRTIAQVSQSAEVRPAALVRVGEARLADPETRLEEGDLLIAASRQEDLGHLRNLVGGEAS
ncbi:MAG: TrkA family potassium uptake protein [Anaerolineales bacterium]